MNPIAEALTGWRRRRGARSSRSTRCSASSTSYSRDVVESPVAKVLREGGVVGLANHTLLIARDGAERPIDDSGAPIRDAGGEIMGVVLVFRDVTARRLAEQARERLLRAEAARDERRGARTARRTSSWPSSRTSCARRSPPRRLGRRCCSGGALAERPARARARHDRAQSAPAVAAGRPTCSTSRASSPASCTLEPRVRPTSPASCATSSTIIARAPSPRASRCASSASASDASRWSTARGSAR